MDVLRTAYSRDPYWSNSSRQCLSGSVRGIAGGQCLEAVLGGSARTDCPEPDFGFQDDAIHTFSV